MKDITVLVCMSPMPSMPSTDVVDMTILSIRERLPDCPIFFLFDGVPAKSMQYLTAYNEFKQKMLWKINEMGNATPFVFEEHKHQSGMVKDVIKLVQTSMVLFIEQDTPLHNDIPFKEIAETIKCGYCNTVRFHFEADIPKEHEHLMLDKEPIDILGVPLIRTKQWSGRPHLSSTTYYRHMIDNHTSEKPMFLEHCWYGIISEGGDNYDEHRLHIYSPSGTLVRSKHLDGRRYGASNYDPSAS
jgi:hypothetical protein